MHVLDAKINDIVPRIADIYKSASEAEPSSTQESLSSYGWILLDSWITWRTLRYLLRKTEIDEAVCKKWFQTPSSYTGSQIYAAWKFNESELVYIDQKLGQSAKKVMDEEIVQRRNTAAHFNGGVPIRGDDYNRINSIFNCFSKVFLFIELSSFLHDYEVILKRDKYVDMKIFTDDGKSYSTSIFPEAIESFAMSSYIKISFMNQTDDYYVVTIDDSGCMAGCGKDLATIEQKSVISKNGSSYFLLANNGYYLPVQSFCDDVFAAVE